MTKPATDPGSFRDRESRVFTLDGRLCRALSPTALSEWRFVEQASILHGLIEARKVVGSREVEIDPDILAGIGPAFVAALEHEPVPFLSYPYEWSFSMLRDAAELTLDILDTALAKGGTLKDASAYNVQFRGAEPVFIDLGSFEKYKSGESWIGYRQFCEMFLFPLMLEAYRGISFQPRLRGCIDGVGTEEMWHTMSVRDLFRRGVPTHVYLQAKLGRTTAATKKNVRKDLAASGFSKEMIRHNVASMRKLIARLRPRASDSHWTAYTDTRSYTQDDTEAKQTFVRRAVDASRPDLVWDLGCNTGEFSKLAAETASYVVAMDQDPQAIDRLYRELPAQHSDRILPLVISLTDPSPDLGWRGTERRSIWHRQAPDMILALALTHHLSIAANVPVRDLMEWFAGLGGSLVVEFVSKDDPMVEQLLRNKIDNYSDWQRDVFEAELARHFEIADQVELGSGTRFLYYAHPRALG
ncbi:MAG: class I SAM-dependent methyltransferase [Acidobacteriota bacterium]|nr:class I SAM-dependent methyltransferase [Acidobacteriota bacterium]